MKALAKFSISGHKELGFTLIEVIVALCITSVIGLGASQAIFQIVNVNAMSNTRLTTIKQVENAVYYLSRDAQMAQTIEVSAGSGFPLTLSWTEWGSTTHEVIYSIQDNEMFRDSSINSGPSQTLVISRDIDSNSAQTNCQYSGGVFTGKITATISGFRGASESRSFQVIPRAAQ